MSRKRKIRPNPLKNQNTRCVKRSVGLFAAFSLRHEWFLLAQVVIIPLVVLLEIFGSDDNQAATMTYNLFGDTFPLSGINSSSVNHDGQAIIRLERKGINLAALVNIGNGEQEFCHYYLVDCDEKKYTLSKYVYADDGRLYASIIDFADEEESMNLLRERIVRLNDDFTVDREYCTINYDQHEGLQLSKLSQLCCTEGKITFACIERNETRLYSIDPETDSLTISDPYPTDPDGTFTFEVLPLSDSFIFMRSDGSVYRTRFGEPLGESIFRFEEHPEITAAFSNTPQSSAASCICTDFTARVLSIRLKTARLPKC